MSKNHAAFNHAFLQCLTIRFKRFSGRLLAQNLGVDADFSSIITVCYLPKNKAELRLAGILIRSSWLAKDDNLENLSNVAVALLMYCNATVFTQMLYKCFYCCWCYSCYYIETEPLVISGGDLYMPQALPVSKPSKQYTERCLPPGGDGRGLVFMSVVVHVGTGWSRGSNWVISLMCVGSPLPVYRWSCCSCQGTSPHDDVGPPLTPPPSPVSGTKSSPNGRLATDSVTWLPSAQEQPDVTHPISPEF